MNILLLIKGIIIGIAKIIPGLSGALIMLSLNLYDKAIDAITNFFTNFKKNLIFLTNLGLGVIIGIVLFSKIINYYITNYYLYTTSLFIGLIIGGIPSIIKKTPKSITNISIIITSFILIILLTVSNLDNTYTVKNNNIDLIIFFISGLLEAIGTIIPGISSTALLMLLGVYNIYIKSISNLLDINYILLSIRFILPFFIGLFIGFITISLLINYLFKKYNYQTFSFIIGISLASIFLLIIKIIPSINDIKSVVISIIILTIGYLITYRL